jgi:hypothetical protein
MQRELLNTPHSVIVADDGSLIVQRVRTSARFASLDEVTREYQAIVAALDRVDRPTYAILVDLRDAPPRNDDDYEAIARHHGPGLYADFRKVAVLVHSAAGRLQVRRFLDVSRPDAGVYSEEREARAFLAG